MQYISIFTGVRISAYLFNNFHVALGHLILIAIGAMAVIKHIIWIHGLWAQTINCKWVVRDNPCAVMLLL